MYRFNFIGNVMFIFLLSCANSQVIFNSLNEKLVLSLLGVTQKQNVVACEQLVRFTLCKLATVAKGEAKKELMSILGYKDDAALHLCYSRIKPYVRAMASFDLAVMNRIFVNYTNEIDPMFIANATENDGLSVSKVSFQYPKAAIRHINNLISHLTLRSITDIVDENDLNRTTNMIIASGAHFRATWETPFDYRLTKLRRFHLMDGRTTSIPMMTKVDEYFYGTGTDCEVLSIRLRTWLATMTIVLPTSVKVLPKVMDKIYAQKGISSFLRNTLSKYMRITIPKFKIKTFVDWTGFLKGFGLYSVFDRSSLDLSDIYKEGFRNKSMYLSKVKQKVFIQIDEMGMDRQIPIPEITERPFAPVFQLHEFTADRPFFFEIAFDLEGDRYPMFTGIYYGPEASPDAF